VTFVEFFDYNCGYCKSMFPSMMDTIKQDGKIRVIMKEFPILGPPSLTASRVALAARKQGKYSETHLALLGHKGALSDESVMQIAKDVGLDLKKLQDDMKSPEITVILGKNHDLADALGIDGTPALVIGDTLVDGAVGQGRLGELIAAARKK
jgi:protein-disulfide isomerase